VHTQDRSSLPRSELDHDVWSHLDQHPFENRVLGTPTMEIDGYVLEAEPGVVAVDTDRGEDRGEIDASTLDVVACLRPAERR